MTGLKEIITRNGSRVKPRPFFRSLFVTQEHQKPCKIVTRDYVKVIDSPAESISYGAAGSV